MHGRAHPVAPFATCVLWSIVLAIAASAACVRSPSQPRCPDDRANVLGACVTLSVADAYCQAGKPDRIHLAHMNSTGCVFADCPNGRRLDLVTGKCDSAPGWCDDGEVTALARGSSVCVAIREACPRGTRGAYEGRADGNSEQHPGDWGARGGPRSAPLVSVVCRQPPPCPLGTIRYDDACLPILVTRGFSGNRPGVDLAAWSTAVFGPNGGDGSSDLCRPLAWTGPGRMPNDSSSRPDPQPSNNGGARGEPPSAPLVDGGARGGPRSAPLVDQLRLRIALVAPNDDVASVQASVVVRTLPNGEPPRPNLVEAARASVGSLLEPLRALGGESSTAVVVSEVTCSVPAPIPASRTPPTGDAGADVRSLAFATE
jgi:hypothetical protein